LKVKFLPLALCGVLCSGALAFTSCAEERVVRVYAPDGAPALALAQLLAEDETGDGVEYTVTSANKIATFVTGRDPQADVCVLPVNLASTLLGDGSVYQMVGLATHGNMYLLSADPTTYGATSAEGLKGKKIGVVQLGNVPGLTFRSALSRLGVSYSLTGVSADDAYLYAVQPTEVSPLGEADVYLCPEPAASAKIKAFTAQGKPFYTVGDLQTLYGGAEGYPQACVVAKKSFIADNPAAFDKIIDGLTAGAAFLSTAEISTVCDAVASHLEAGLAATFSTANLTQEVIARCNVRFERSEYCYARVDAFLGELTAIAPNSASAVAPDFYYF